VPGGLEFPCRGPRLAPVTEARQLRTDALACPVPACQIRVLRQDITSRAPSSDPLEDTGLDKLREIVGRLRSAHFGELLISPASQFCLPAVAQDCERPVLGRLEFLSGGNWRHPLTPLLGRFPKSKDTALEPLVCKSQNARQPGCRPSLWARSRSRSFV
jgi:hypothetical protein